MDSFMDALNSALMRDRRWRPHPDQRPGGTNKIATYLNSRGDAIAIDLSSGGENAVWTLARLVPDTMLPEIRREPYVPEKGRNSNLSVSQLKGKALVRLYPSSLPEARLLIDQLSIA
jgi:hypothetical protein